MTTETLTQREAQLKEAARNLLDVAIALNNTSDLQLKNRVLGALAAIAPADVVVGELAIAVHEVFQESSDD